MNGVRTTVKFGANADPVNYSIEWSRNDEWQWTNTETRTDTQTLSMLVGPGKVKWIAATYKTISGTGYFTFTSDVSEQWNSESLEVENSGAVVKTGAFISGFIECELDIRNNTITVSSEECIATRPELGVTGLKMGLHQPITTIATSHSSSLRHPAIISSTSKSPLIPSWPASYSKWTQVNGLLVKGDMSPTTFCGFNRINYIYCKSLHFIFNPQHWMRLDGLATDVSVSSNSLLVVGTDNRLYYHDDVGNRKSKFRLVQTPTTAIKASLKDGSVCYSDKSTYAIRCSSNALDSQNTAKWFALPISGSNSIRMPSGNSICAITGNEKALNCYKLNINSNKLIESVENYYSSRIFDLVDFSLDFNGSIFAKTRKGELLYKKYDTEEFLKVAHNLDIYSMSAANGLLCFTKPNLEIMCSDNN